jgi:hypothetical protein
MSEQHEQAGQLDKAEEVFDVVFPSRDQAAVFRAGTAKSDKGLSGGSARLQP